MTISITHQSGSRPTASAVDRGARFEREALPLRQELERAARRYTRNVHDAEDLLQETFAKAWAGYGSFDPDTNLRAWMFRIMVNTWISSHRRTERRPKEALTDSFTDAQLGAESTRSGAYRPRKRKHCNGCRMTASGMRYRLCPRTFRRSSTTPTSVSSRTRRSPRSRESRSGTVMSRVYRARRQLRVALCDVAAEHGYAHGVPCGVAA